MYLHISLYIMYIIYTINSFISEQQSFEMPLKTKLLEAESSLLSPLRWGLGSPFPSAHFSQISVSCLSPSFPFSLPASPNLLFTHSVPFNQDQLTRL